jgi:hypothetical protein
VARTAWRTQLREALDAVTGEQTPFVCETTLPLADRDSGRAALTLRCDGVAGEPMALPLSADAVDALRAAAHRAPFGLDADTVVDTAVRDAWQLDASAVRLDAAWGPALLDQVLAEAVSELGVPPESAVRAQLYKLVLYEPGGHFKPHRDTEKAPGMFGTLVVQLPVIGGHTGADLLIRHRGTECTVDTESEAEEYIITAAFFADCEHELTAVTAGRRVCLVYSLIADVPGARLPSAAEAAIVARRDLAAAVAAWPAGQPVRIAVPLAHKYTAANLSFGRLKGTDAILLAELRGHNTVADSADGVPMVEVALALIERELYGRDERSLREQRVRVTKWVGPDDAQLPGGCSLGSLRLSASEDDEAAELLPGDELDWPDPGEEEPDHRRRTSYTGNEGPDVTYFYHRTALVLWRRERGVELALREGIGAGLALARWRAARGEADAASALEAVTAHVEAAALAAAEAAAVRTVQDAAEDAENAAEGRPARYRWTTSRQRDLGDSEYALPVLEAASQLGASAAGAACRVLRAMALPHRCGVDEAAVAPLAKLAASSAACADVAAALTALVAVGCSRGEQLRNCIALATSVAARGSVERANLIAAVIVDARATSSSAADAFEMPQDGPLRTLALLSFADSVTAERAALAPKAASDDEDGEADDDDEWEGSSKDGSYCSGES